MKRKKILVVIPAFNEENMITHVLKTIPYSIEKNLLKILVIDDGSTDKTKALVKKQNILVLSHLFNRGLGGALGTGFAYARLHQYDALVTFDADGQHNADDISRLINPILKKQADITIGSRMLDARGMPVFRRIINTFSNILTFLLFNIWTSDSQSGLRAFSKQAIQKIQISTQGMEVSSEIFREIKRNKFQMHEIPIKAVYTDYSLYKGQKLTNAVPVFLKLMLHQFRFF